MVGDRDAAFELIDETAGLELSLEIGFATDGELVIGTTLGNIGSDEYTVVRLAPSLTLPSRAVDLVSFDERWCIESQPDRTPLRGRRVVENRRTRTSHSHLPAVIAETAGFGESDGEVWTAQLAWSGSFSISAEALVDGRRYLQLGALLEPGEVAVAPGASYAAPDVVAAWSPAGLNAVSQSFHRRVR